MRLHWFSPLPPDRSEIAHYATTIVEALAKEAEVTVWTEGHRSDVHVPRGATMRAYHPGTEAFEVIAKGDCAFFNIGNNVKFHAWIWHVSQAIPGIAIVHDATLQGLFIAAPGSAEGYTALMRRTYGHAGESAAGRVLRGEVSLLDLSQAYPLTPVAFENALAGVIHWPGALRDPHVPVRCLPLPYAARAHPPRARPIGANAPARLMMMGHLGPNRRVLEMLDALAAFPRRDQVHLDIYGTVEIHGANGLLDVRTLAGERGLASQVTHHGFVPADRLEAALRKADLLINLRVPTMGEVSATQLRAWDHALPTLVSRNGWYATIPPEAVGFVRVGPPEAEREDIHRHLAALLDDPASYIAMGRAGRRLLEERHAVGPYVAGLLELARAAPQLAAEWAQGYLADRVGALTAGWPENDGFPDAAAERIFDLFEA